MLAKFYARLKNWSILPGAFFVAFLGSLGMIVNTVYTSIFGIVSQSVSAVYMLVLTLGCFCLTPIIALCTFVPKWDFELSLFESYVKDEWTTACRVMRS